MAELVVTFSMIDASVGFDAPLARGRECRTQVLADYAPGTLTVDGEQTVELLADVDCWVAIGPAPDAAIATDGTGTARKLKAGVSKEYTVADGDKVVWATV